MRLVTTASGWVWAPIGGKIALQIFLRASFLLGGRPGGGWGMGGKSALMGEVSKNSWKGGSSRISTPSLKQNPKTPTQIRVNKHAMSLKICQKTKKKKQENWINSKNHRENKKTGSVKTIVLDRDPNMGWAPWIHPMSPTSLHFLVPPTILLKVWFSPCP